MRQGTNRLETLRTLQVALWDVAFATAFGTIVSGTFLIGFAKSLGGSDLWIGLLVAIPSLLGLLQIPGAVWGRAKPSYKRFVAPGGWIWRLLYIPLIVLPLVAWDADLKLRLLALCIGLATAAVQLVSPIYSEWIAEILPESSRGWYFSQRTAVSTAVAMIVAFAGGVLLDGFRQLGKEDLGFAILFGAGSLCSLISMGFFLRMRDRPRAAPTHIGLRESVRQLRAPIRSPNFRRLLVYFVVFTIGATMAGGLFVAFARETLALSYTAIQLTQVAHAVGTVIASRAWGFLTDRYGNKPILVILSVGTILTPLVWLACQPGRTTFNIVVLVVGHVYNGIVWSGVGVAQTNLTLATADDSDRANFLGMSVAVQSLVGGLAPIGGALLMGAMRSGVSAEHAYKTVFASIMLVRVVAVISLWPIHEDGAVGLRKTLRRLKEVTPKGVLALRALSQSSEVGTRARAVARVGAAHLSLGISELMIALDDPAPRVRREAALSLARLGDASAAPGLIRHILENPETVEEETLIALGAVAGPEAVPLLAGYLRDPSALLRRAAARALGSIGEPIAIDPLSEAAADVDDPDLRRAALQALRRLGSEGADSVVAAALLDPHPSVRTAAAEAAIESRSSLIAKALRRSLEVFPVEGASEVAYALGSVGAVGDAATIVAAARAATSSRAKRRCLLGLARLWHVESTVYRLLNMQGMGRDARFVQEIGGALKTDTRLRAAVRLAAGGRDVDALRVLAREASLGFLAQSQEPDPELFLVAAVARARERHVNPE